MKYTLEFKVQKVIKYFNTIIPVSTFCRQNNIPRTTFIYWLKQYEDKTLGRILKSTGRKTIITRDLIQLVKDLIDKYNYTTIYEIHEKCKKQNYKICLSTVYNIIRQKLNYSYKKAKVFIRPDNYDVEELLNSISFP